MSSATPMTRLTLIIVRIRLPRTCPISTEERAIAIVRKRVMMPSLMSMHRFSAVVCAAAAHGHDEDAGREVVDVGAAVCHAAETRADRAAEDVVEQQQHDDWHQQATERHKRGCAASAGHRAAASSPNRAGQRKSEYSWFSAFLGVGVAGEGEEHIVQVGGMHRDAYAVNRVRFVVKPVEDRLAGTERCRQSEPAG